MSEALSSHVLEPLNRTAVVGPPAEPPDDAFFHALRSSRLIPESEAGALEHGFRADPSLDLHAALVGSEKLTAYQYERLRRGEPQGLVIGPYAVLDELGRGGGGKVFRARHRLLGRVVALKVIDPRYSEGRAARDVFRRELAAATRLDHPNIARVHDANEVDGVLYLAMECVDGPTLHKYALESGGGLAAGLAAAALLQTAEALQHAHENGLVHRDIKPANIMFPGALRRPDEVPPRPLIKVVDFGLARLLSAGHGVSTIRCPDGAALGTPAFMAPEQIRNVHAADIRSDLYSLGCSFYFALSGRLPFEGATSRSTLLMHLEREPTPLRALSPSVPAALSRIVHRLMAKNPADRYQTPAELAEALTETVLSGALSGDEAPAPPARRPAPGAASTVALAPPRPAAPPPRSAPAPLATAALRWNWVRWREVVEARFTGQPPQIGAEEYKVLYRGLLTAIGAARDGSAEAEGRLDQLQAVVEPWVTLQSLSDIDRCTLVELHRLCGSLSTLVAPPVRARGRRGGAVWAALAAALLAAGGAAAVYRPDLVTAGGDFVRTHPLVGLAALAAGASLALAIQGRSSSR